jgi:GT2 family glycosyltransferase
LTLPKVLAYVHTYNDADVIEDTIRALCDQTYPITEILLVDNASTDDTLNRPFPAKVTIIRNDKNLGTSGAVAQGMEFALARGFDWIYILDADSHPRADAIENLVKCYRNLTPELQATTWWLSSLLVEGDNAYLHEGCIFTPHGIELLHLANQETPFQCDSNMWSGSLYRLEAVKQVGLPDRNYVLDWGDMIYGYEGKVRGYTGFLEPSSVVRHNLHPIPTLRLRRLGPWSIRVFHSPPMRTYYFWRNSMYFWAYIYGSKYRKRAALSHILLFFRWLLKALLFVEAPLPVLRAAFRGMWDGLRARLELRY